MSGYDKTSKAWYEAHKEEEIQRVMAWQKEHNEYLKYEDEARYVYVADILGKECRYCGEKDPKVLCIDHIYGGGRKDKKSRGFRYWILKHPEEAKKKLQILCANCNMRKVWDRDENGYRNKTKVLVCPSKYNKSNTNERWSEEDITLLKEKYLLLTDSELKLFCFPDRSVSAIMRARHRLGLVKTKKWVHQRNSSKLSEKINPCLPISEEERIIEQISELSSCGYSKNEQVKICKHDGFTDEMIDKQGLPVTRKIQTSSGRLNPTDRQERVKKVCELMNGGHSYRQALRIMHELGYSISLHQVWLDFETNRSQITQSNIEAEQCKQTQLELPIEQPSFFG